MKRKSVILLGALMIIMCIGLMACGSEEESSDATEATEAVETTEPTEATVDGTDLGYDGDDPAVLAVYEYIVDEFAKNYEPDADTISIPAVSIVDQSEGEGGETLIRGIFYVYNYKVEGDTLKCVSGGSYPGAMHVVKEGEDYKVSSFDAVEDGGRFDPTAKEIFGDKYDAFTKAYSDDKSAEADRAKAIATYVQANGLEVTKYQDEGWDPIDIPLQ